MWWRSCQIGRWSVLLLSSAFTPKINFIIMRAGDFAGGLSLWIMLRGDYSNSLLSGAAEKRFASHLKISSSTLSIMLQPSVARRPSLGWMAYPVNHNDSNQSVSSFMWKKVDSTFVWVFRYSVQQQKQWIEKSQWLALCCVIRERQLVGGNRQMIKLGEN